MTGYTEGSESSIFFRDVNSFDGLTFVLSNMFELTYNCWHTIPGVCQPALVLENVRNTSKRAYIELLIVFAVFLFVSSGAHRFSH